MKEKVAFVCVHNSCRSQIAGVESVDYYCEKKNKRFVEK